MMEIVERIKQLVVEGEDELIESHIQEAIENGVEPREIIEEALLKAIQKVGELWSDGAYFVPDVILSAETFQKAMELIRSKLDKSEATAVPHKVIIGSVQGDMHDLGKNIVVALLEGNGFQVIDLGVDVSTETFVQKCSTCKPDILALGAYISSTMTVIPEVIKAVRSAGFKDVKILIGGASVTRPFADEVGADGFGEDAVEAVSEANRLMNGGNGQ